MSTSKETGTQGELEIVAKVPCPNCGKKLMQLPMSYPLYDVQCTACYFRAQVKTSMQKPSDTVLGAGWDIISKVTKAGYQVPPLLINFKWINGQVIRFYPFIPRIVLKKRILSPTAKRANYAMFSYVGLNTLPYFTLYSK